ncbi:N-acetylmuramoyl-L-alanine amidase [Leifsonia rubra CMS 76R]|nr:N-acetylmuramoyl-L-alanine amidase [Leifsonia rubra CMS 76R]
MFKKTALILLASASVFPLLLTGVAAQANPPQFGTRSALEDAPPVALPPIMDTYPRSDFVAAGKELPDALVEAIYRDLGKSAEEYLAEAAAAVDAATLLTTLISQGVEVEGSDLAGVELRVFVSDPADAEIVEALGASVVIGVPPVVDFSDVDFTPMADLRGGQAFYVPVDDKGGNRCSVGFNGHSKIVEGRQFVAAGHCYAPPPAGGANYVSLSQASPTITGATLTSSDFIGNAYAASVKFGGGYDSMMVNITNPSLTSKNEVLTWGGGQGAPLASTPLAVRDTIVGVPGAPVCKSGSTTGWTCGQILAVDRTVSLTTGETVNVVIADLCMLPGDSGGPGIVGNSALGINSSGSWTTSCQAADQVDPNPVSAFFPMDSTSSTKPSVARYTNTTWELGVDVAAPVVTSPAGGAGAISSTGSISGTLAYGNTRHRVRVFIEGKMATTAAPVNPDGTWSTSLVGYAPGQHTYQLQAEWGQTSKSTLVSGSFSISATPTDRITGQDRYEVAINVSKRLFPNAAIDSPSVVYVVTGSDYPDALSAAPAAVSEGAPLLLTRPTLLPAAVKAELQRLSPQKIVVVGGTGAVTSAVFSQLQAIAPQVVRLGGADRYISARTVVDYAFVSATTAYVATGQNFPDALAASAAGGAIGAPVILVRGGLTTLDASTRNLLISLGVTQIKIAGGPGVVSPGIANALASIAPVTRLGGADRFLTSDAINSDAYTSASRVYLTTGYNFPDALAGAALAGKEAVPMYSVKTTCIPSYVLADIAALGAGTVTLLGGPGALTQAVANLTPC